MNPLIILGFDGLDRHFMQDSLAEFDNLMSIEKSRRGGFLESTLPPITVPAWISSFTGKRPDTLDRFDFQVIDFDSYEFRPERNTDYWFQEFWEFMTGEAAIVDVPGTELREMNGWMVAGMMNISEEVTCPPDLKEELLEEVGDFELEGFENFKSEKRKRRKSFEYFEKRKSILNWMLENKDADVYFAVFRLPDNMMHHCENDEQMLEAYKRCNEYLGELMEEGYNIITLSDHGAVKADTRFSINTWLKNKGYLKQKEFQENPLWKQKIFQIAEKLELMGFRDILVWANNTYKELTGEPFTERNLKLNTVEWSKTEAFSYMTGVCNYSGVWINDERFSEPAVDDLEGKKSEIASDLQENELVDDVLIKGQDYSRNATTFPDLVAVLKQNVKNDSDIKPSVSGRISSYMHRKQGFIGTHGDVFEGSDDNAELIDLAPTVLHYFGEAIPEEMDGKVLDIFANDSDPGRRKPRFTDGDISNIEF